MQTGIDALRDFFQSRRVAVTGGASFIGSHLSELLVQLGAQVTVSDDLSSGRLENLNNISSEISFLQGDLKDPTFAHQAVCGAEVVFHLAAAHGGRGYIETHPVECLGNLRLDNVVFSSAAQAGAAKIIFASSACVYPTQLQANEAERRLLKESDAGFDRPGAAFADGEYGWAKLMGELQLRAIHKQYGITGACCRLFTAYGERENETHAVIALIAKTLMRLDPFPIWGNGEQTRNFTYVEDIVHGLAMAAARIEGYQTLNIGSANHISILELLETIFALEGWKPSEISRELQNPVGVKSRASDNTRCKELLGWEAAYPLEKGLTKTIEWYRRCAGKERLRDFNRLSLSREQSPSL